MNDAAGSKKAILSFGIDQRSLNQALSGIRQLTTELKTLVETISRAHSGMQAIGGAGGLFGGITTKGGAGAISPAQQQAMRGGSVLTQGIAADAKALASSTKAGTDALRGLSSATKTSVAEQIGNIQRLRQELKQLEGSYAKLSGLNAAPGSRAAARLDSVRAERELELRLKRDQLSRANADFEMNRPDYGGFEGGGGGGPGWWQRNYKGTGFGNLKSFAASPSMGGLFRAAGTGGMLASVALAMAEGARAASVARDEAEAREVIARGTDAIRRQAATSQSLGQLGLRARYNVNTGLALATLSPTAVSGVLGPQAEAARRRAVEAQYNPGGTKQFLGDFASRAGLAVNAFRDTDGFFNGVGAFFGTGYRNLRNTLSGNANDLPREWERQRALSDLPARRAEAAAAMAAQAQESLNPLEAMYREQFVGDWQGRVARMRQIRSAATSRRGPGGMIIPGNAAETLGVGTPYTAGELGGMTETLHNAAGGRYGGAAARMLSMQYGGLQGGAGIFGIAAGYGSPGGFMGALSGGSSMSGAAGLNDVNIAGSLASLYQQGMTGGDFFTNGQRGLQGLQAATAMFGGDLRAMRGASAGQGGLAGYYNGSNDPLQLAINTAAAAAVDPRLYVQQAYMGMSPEQRADLMRRIDSGEIKGDTDLPPELREQGITVAGLKKYGGGRDRHLFARYMTKQGMPDIGAAVDAYRRQGFGSLRGMGPAQMRKQFRLLGRALMSTNKEAYPTLDAAQNVLARMAGTETPDLLPALTGGGIGDVAAHSAEIALAKQSEDSNILRQEGSLVSPQQRGAIRQGLSESAKQIGDSLTTVSQSIDVSGTKLRQALEGVTRVLNQWVHGHDAAGVSRPKAEPLK